MKKQVREYSGRLDEHAPAFFIRHDHHDAITETLSLNLVCSLFIGSLFPLAGFGLSESHQNNSDSFEKPRHGSLSPFYIGFLMLFYSGERKKCRIENSFFLQTFRPSLSPFSSFFMFR